MCVFLERSDPGMGTSYCDDGSRLRVVCMRHVRHQDHAFRPMRERIFSSKSQAEDCIKNEVKNV